MASLGPLWPGMSTIPPSPVPGSLALAGIRGVAAGNQASAGPTDVVQGFRVKDPKFQSVAYKNCSLFCASVQEVTLPALITHEIFASCCASHTRCYDLMHATNQYYSSTQRLPGTGASEQGARALCRTLDSARYSPTVAADAGGAAGQRLRFAEGRRWMIFGAGPGNGSTRGASPTRTPPGHAASTNRRPRAGCTDRPTLHRHHGPGQYGAATGSIPPFKAPEGRIFPTWAARPVAISHSLTDKGHNDVTVR